ncbi:hypothetical protein BDW75DRAFT_215526 [Aspergillus navahoensis]
MAIGLSPTTSMSSHQSPAGHRGSHHCPDRSSGWTDCSIRADVTIRSDSGVAGLVARASASKTAPNSVRWFTAAIDSNRGISLVSTRLRPDN